MSASERLKALSVSRAIDWPAPSYEAYRMAEDAERLRKNAIERALPELIALVEAAERVKSIALDGDHALKDERIFDNLYEALAALDAKLSVT